MLAQRARVCDSVSWLPTVALALLAPALGWLNRGGRSWGLALAGLAACAALPFVGPAGVMLVQIVLSAWAVIYGVKTWECHRGGAFDPAMWKSPARFLIWWFVPPDTIVPQTDAQAEANRAEGRRRVARGLLKLVAYVALLELNRRWDGLHDSVIVHNLWGLWMLYALLTGLADSLTGLVMQLGLHAVETFDRPFLSASPREFWSRRWNLFIARFAARSVFFPLDGVHKPVRATVVVFAASGLMHEYLVWAVARAPVERVGWMMAFFLGNAAAVVLQAAVQRRLGRAALTRLRRFRALGVLLHTAWLVAGMGLFLPPLDEAVGFSSWWR